MTDWYRRKTWTQTDEEEYFAKLNRARKYSRPQYLKIQAIELVETEDPQLLDVAEMLIKKLFTDHPEDKLEKSSCLETLGDIYKHRQQYVTAVDFYKQAIDFEKSYPNVLTEAYLSYSELVVKLGMVDRYNDVDKLVAKRIKGSFFPIEKYKAFSILSIINSYKGDKDKADKYATLADKNASAETSELKYHKYLGIVVQRDTLLDNLVKPK